MNKFDPIRPSQSQIRPFKDKICPSMNHYFFKSYVFCLKHAIFMNLGTKFRLNSTKSDQFWSNLILNLIFEFEFKFRIFLVEFFGRIPNDFHLISEFVRAYNRREQIIYFN